MTRISLLARSGLGLALATALLAGGYAAPALAKDNPQSAAPKLSPSKAFIPLFQAAQTAIEAAGKRADVAAAKAAYINAVNAYNNASGAARTAAKAQLDSSQAALIQSTAGERAKVDAAIAGATSPDDQFYAGQLAVNLGQINLDHALQRKALEMMVASGKTPPANVGQYNYYIGKFAYEAGDYPAAERALEAAIAAGYTQNDVKVTLAEVYLTANQPTVGLAKLKDAIESHGGVAPEDWYKRGIVVAYKAKLVDQSGWFSQQLVSGYPTKDNWSLAISVLRDTARYPAQETLDLMRLMDRTSSYAESRDFYEYIQAADPRRLPNEVLHAISVGVASGKLTPDVSLNDAKAQASGRLAADKASLPAAERDARAANANAAAVMAAGDAYQEWNEPAKAAEMFTLALTKPGVDAARALTRLGIAQTDLGQYAAAQATFAKVTGPRAAMAQLWSIYVANKAKPAT